MLALVLQVACSVAAFGTLFLMPVFTESVQGHTALETGLALLPQGVLMGLGTYVGQRVAARVRLRTLVVGVFLMLLARGTPLWVVAAILSGRAVAVGFVTTPLLVATLAPLAENQLADGNTLFSIVQRVGGSIGVGLLGSMIAGATTVDGAIAQFHEAGAALVAVALVAAVAGTFLPDPATATE